MLFVAIDSKDSQIILAGKEAKNTDITKDKNVIIIFSSFAVLLAYIVGESEILSALFGGDDGIF